MQKFPTSLSTGIISLFWGLKSGCYGAFGHQSASAEDKKSNNAPVKRLLWRLIAPSLLWGQYELCSNTAEKRILGEILKDQNHSLSLIRKQQRKLEKSVKDLLDSAGGGNLVTIPGIGTILAGKIIAHTGGIERFQTIDKFIKYAGIAPSERSSGKSKRYVKNTKGNRKLNTTFYLSALGQICWNPKAKVYYQKKITEGKSKKQALVCVMKRIAMIIYAMLKSGEAYRG